MSFPQYQEYQDSGHIWLSDVPGHWALRRLGHYFEERRERASDTEFEPLSVTKRGIVPQLESAAKTQDGDNRKKVLAGDFVINSRSDRKGSSGLSPTDGSVSLICTVLTPAGLHGPFIHHLLRSELFQEEYYRWGKGIVADLWSTNFSDMKNIVLSVPPEAEQAQIARFLDHETARIDALIEEQQRLIELLKEKRQAVISYTVTKGLDPTVPMKDSGVEWLGKVPEHWAVKKIKHYGRVVGGYAFKSTDFCDEGHLVLKISNVGHLGFEWDDSSYLPEDFAKDYSDFIAPKGSLIFAMTRPVISGGIKVSRLEEDLRPLINQRVGFISINDETLSRFLLVSSQSESFLSQFKNNLTITNQPNISSEGIESIQVAIPPREELRIILDYLEGLNSSFKSLVMDAQRGIELLQERRSALISATVTGKIDVRGWKPPASAPTHALAQEAV